MLFIDLIVSSLFLFILLKGEASILLIVPIFLVLFIFFSAIVLQMPKMEANKRRQEIESDLIYTVRHFLLRMECGGSLLNALEETSKIDTISAKYFGEVIHDIDIGSPIEEAIDYAIKFTPSDRFKEVMNVVKIH